MNVLLILSDQHLATCLGHEGHPQVKTPNLDSLAAGSTRFRQAYTQNPICTPSRTCILSGQYCHNHGYYGLSGPAPHALPSFFSHFKEHGYRTAGIGNLHTPDDPRNWLESHLDLFLDYCESVDGRHEQTPFYDKLRALGLMEKEDIYFFHRNPRYGVEGFPSPLPFELSQEGWSVEEAIRFMESCAGRPFCMEVSLQRPHQPFTPDKRFWDLYPEDLALPPTLNQDPSGRPPHFRASYEGFRKMQWPIEPNNFEAGARRLWRGYLGCISHVDHAVGLLLDYLDRAGLASNTLVMYSADHGAYSGTHGIPEKAPGICSDAVCRVPLICRVPGVTRPRAVCHQLVELVDLAPTFASLCGLPPMKTADGKDLSPLLRGEDTPVRDVAVTEHPWSKALRWKRWRFVHYQREMFGGRDIGELYDLEADPNEASNLYGSPPHRSVVQECRRLLLEWIIRTRRVATVWPALDWSRSPYDYQTAGDGKESNTAGPAARVKKGQLHYI
ncbi:MAG: sulfatase-like hydrolase/transferase [Planctomycetes bacterium]|nr:sulfatase-like hydrolase/transferase [Planctomycetota bacterium]